MAARKEEGEGCRPNERRARERQSRCRQRRRTRSSTADQRAARLPRASAPSEGRRGKGRAGRSGAVSARSRVEGGGGRQVGEDRGWWRADRGGSETPVTTTPSPRASAMPRAPLPPRRRKFGAQFARCTAPLSSSPASRTRPWLAPLPGRPCHAPPSPLPLTAACLLRAPRTSPLAESAGSQHSNGTVLARRSIWPRDVPRRFTLHGTAPPRTLKAFEPIYVSVGARARIFFAHLFGGRLGARRVRASVSALSVVACVFFPHLTWFHDVSNA